MNKYKIEVKHDNGTVNVTVTAQNIESAISQVMNFENCPRSAIGSWLKVPTNKQLAKTKRLLQNL